VHASVENRHRPQKFGLLKKVDAVCPTDSVIERILDNHRTHVFKETKAWLATMHEGRFSFVSTPRHRSWFKLVEGFFFQDGTIGAPSSPVPNS
jgi:hypothetical protein